MTRKERLDAILETVNEWSNDTLFSYVHAAINDKFSHLSDTKFEEEYQAWFDGDPPDGEKAYRVVFSMEIIMKAEDEEDLKKQWEELVLGELDTHVDNCEIESHDFVDLYSMEKIVE